MSASSQGFEPVKHREGLCSVNSSLSCISLTDYFVISEVDAKQINRSSFALKVLDL